MNEGIKCDFFWQGPKIGSKFRHQDLRKAIESHGVVEAVFPMTKINENMQE
jgi:hypothetical protein